MRGVVVVQPDAHFVVNGDAVLVSADAAGALVAEENVRRRCVRARLDPFSEILELHKFREAQDEAVNSTASSLILVFMRSDGRRRLSAANDSSLWHTPYSGLESSRIVLQYEGTASLVPGVLRS